MFANEQYMKLAEINVGLENEMILHTRVPFSFMNWLGAIGGVEELLLSVMICLLGGYA